jgi:hypothetical protein
MAAGDVDAPAQDVELPETPADKQAVRVGCQTADLHMQPNQSDHAILLKAPGGRARTLVRYHGGPRPHFTEI